MYETIHGAHQKFGVGNENQLRQNGKFSQRAYEQHRAQKNRWHVVLVILKGGIMARGQAYILEQMMVNFTTNLGKPPANQGLPVANGDDC